MSWRVVIITRRCKLEYKLGYLICRGEETHKVFIHEISTLIIESTAVAITSALMCELVRENVNIVFCDEKHNPISQLNPLNGRFNCSGMLKKQLSWDENRVKQVWTDIIRMKLERQRNLLDMYALDYTIPYKCVTRDLGRPSDKTMRIPGTDESDRDGNLRTPRLRRKKNHDPVNLTGVDFVDPEMRTTAGFWVKSEITWTFGFLCGTLE